MAELRATPSLPTEESQPNEEAKDPRFSDSCDLQAGCVLLKPAGMNIALFPKDMDSVSERQLTKSAFLALIGAVISDTASKGSTCILEKVTVSHLIDKSLRLEINNKWDVLIENKKDHLRRRFLPQLKLGESSAK